MAVPMLQSMSRGRRCFALFLQVLASLYYSSSGREINQVVCDVSEPQKLNERVDVGQLCLTQHVEYSARLSLRFCRSPSAHLD
jgi:hypothetical protein